jgi:small-conductance mechanosensitive channel
MVMVDVAKAVAAVADAAEEQAAEAAEAAVEAAEARAEAAEEARDLLAEAALRDEISGRVDALRTEYEACRASHESRMTDHESVHAGLKQSFDTLQAELREVASRLPVVVPIPSSTSGASPLQAVETEAETVAGAVVIPAQAEAAAVVPAGPGTARRRGRFL